MQLYIHVHTIYELLVEAFLAQQIDRLLRYERQVDPLDKEPDKHRWRPGIEIHQ